MTSTGLVVCLLVTLTLPGDVIAQSAAQTAATGVSAQELYQRALVQEHAQGDLHQAVALYAQAARRAGNDRMLAAKALIRMAGSQEKLGADLEAARSIRGGDKRVSGATTGGRNRAGTVDGVASHDIGRGEPRSRCHPDRRVIVDSATRGALLRQLPQRAEKGGGTRPRLGGPQGDQ
jgi:hypothetical protein